MGKIQFKLTDVCFKKFWQDTNQKRNKFIFLIFEKFHLIKAIDLYVTNIDFASIQNVYLFWSQPTRKC